MIYDIKLFVPKLAKLPPPSLKNFNNKMYKCLTIELDISITAVDLGTVENLTNVRQIILSMMQHC